MKSEWMAGAALSALIALGMTACDAGPAAVAARQPALEPVAYQPAETPAPEPRQTRRRPAAEPVQVAMIGGKPMWAANRDNSGEENAKAQFERNGADFGTPSVEAYVRRAHDFSAEPPRGTQRIERANGDLLLYDARANVFAVFTKDGAPKTMFKPRDGAAYWKEQQARGSDRAQAPGASPDRG